MSDFMKKTEVNGKKIPTGMFEGSFLYNSGESTYKGMFLGISYETMIAKLSGMGIDLSGTIKEVEYYGVSGTGKEGKNTEYSTKEGNEKYFGSVDFYCMYDGKTYNKDTTDNKIGLTAFINGTGSRWQTFDLSVINFVID
jgi:hypothetical protein